MLQGSSAYVSPGWYPSKQQAHRAAPTYDLCSDARLGPPRRT
ncbi:FMN-binding negative transcriptional regulator [Mycetohabitans sp. B7]|nr:FMN-binding negative transcriptional regulator [Mycetohabitans sp. B3]MCG1039469.1 FMN-binding negative transcriptional regulator [Mycetohabitans sp. B7]